MKVCNTSRLLRKCWRQNSWPRCGRKGKVFLIQKDHGGTVKGGGLWRIEPDFAECCVEQGVWRDIRQNKRHQGRVELIVVVRVTSYSSAPLRRQGLLVLRKFWFRFSSDSSGKLSTVPEGRFKRNGSLCVWIKFIFLFLFDCLWKLLIILYQMQWDASVLSNVLSGCSVNHSRL